MKSKRRPLFSRKDPALEVTRPAELIGWTYEFEVSVEQHDQRAVELRYADLKVTMQSFKDDGPALVDVIEVQPEQLSTVQAFEVLEQRKIDYEKAPSEVSANEQLVQDKVELEISPEPIPEPTEEVAQEETPHIESSVLLEQEIEPLIQTLEPAQPKTLIISPLVVKLGETHIENLFTSALTGKLSLLDQFMKDLDITKWLYQDDSESQSSEKSSDCQNLLILCRSILASESRVAGLGHLPNSLKALVNDRDFGDSEEAALLKILTLAVDSSTLTDNRFRSILKVINQQRIGIIQAQSYFPVFLEASFKSEESNALTAEKTILVLMTEPRFIANREIIQNLRKLIASVFKTDLPLAQVLLTIIYWASCRLLADQKTESAEAALVYVDSALGFMAGAITSKKLGLAETLMQNLASFSHKVPSSDSQRISEEFRRLRASYQQVQAGDKTGNYLNKFLTHFVK